MPFNFSGEKGAAYVAKLGVVSDGNVYTVSAADGYTITSPVYSYNAFIGNPVRSATGVWSVTTKDSVAKVIAWDVNTHLPSGHYLGVQLNTPTLDSSGRLVLNWTFNNAGTPADLPTGVGATHFNVFLEYSEVQTS